MSLLMLDSMAVAAMMCLLNFVSIISALRYGKDLYNLNPSVMTTTLVGTLRRRVRNASMLRLRAAPVALEPSVEQEGLARKPADTVSLTHSVQAMVKTLRGMEILDNHRNDHM
uniref:Neur_chan_memb domain-containing protein n=1 Tax=Ascaris lumbricoides TaxID=6252 RepID=A0A0M3HZ19_ASCLU